MASKIVILDSAPHTSRPVEAVPSSTSNTKESITKLSVGKSVRTSKIVLRCTEQPPVAGLVGGIGDHGMHRARHSRERLGRHDDLQRVGAAGFCCDG